MTDRETFVGLDGTEAVMKSNAADFGVDLALVRVFLTREKMSEALTARKLARVVTETNLRTEAVVRAY